MKQFIRYRNRKLYDPENSQYITSFHILKAVKNSMPFKVTAHPTGEDVTNRIVASALAELLYKNDKALDHLPIESLLVKLSNNNLRELFFPETKTDLPEGL